MSSAPASSNSNKTFTLDPYDNLTRLTTYLTGVTTGVKDTAGNTLSSQYETSSGFTTLSLSAPSNLTATGVAGQVTLDWNAVSGANSYTVYWDNTTGVSSSSTAITSISTDNYTHSSLDNGSTYYYKVAAFDTDNTTGYLSSEVSASTPLPAPDNLSASGANNTITLTWNSVSGATSYTLYWDNASGIDSSDNVIDNITNVNYTHSSLSDGTYYYKVAAVNSSGTGTLSSVASALLSANIQGSETYNAHTYAMTSAAMSFAEAKAAAAALGGYLTTVNTKAENTFLTNTFYVAFGNKALWIGANDIATEGTWVWDNGTTSGDSGLTDNICGTGCDATANPKVYSDATWADGTQKWNGNEPNNQGTEDCANITNANGYWNDLSCGNDQYGIIEFD
jgi:fibronectin type 3 domain-containing protein